MAASPETPASATPRRKVSRHRGEGQWAAGSLHPAERQRADQEGRRRSQRADTHRDDLLQARLRLDRRRRPARPDALVGPLHPAQARDRRRQDRRPGAGGAGRRVLHAAGPDRRRAAHHRAAARHRRDLRGVRPRHRRHHRPAEHPAALDPDRGRAGDLAAAGGRRPVHHRGLRRHPARASSARPVAGIAEDEIIDGTPRASTRSHRRYIGDPAFSNLPRKFKTAVSGSPLLDVAHEINDVAFVGVDPPRARPRLRPLGRRRPVHQPQVRRAARRLGARGGGPRRRGPASSPSSATTATAGCATAPG